MPAAFRPRFRRGGADAEPGGDSAGPLDDVGSEGVSDEGVSDEDVNDQGVNDQGVSDKGVGAQDVSDDSDGGEWLAYELHEWALESRVMLQQLLTVDKVVHSWQGTTLLIHESLEAQVDSLVDEVEETEKAKEAISRPIGPEDALTAFELAEWPEALRAELMERLLQASVPYILDTEGDTAEDSQVDSVPSIEGDIAEDDQPAELGEVCDLLVREADEERVELVIDDLLAREEEAQFDELDGLEVNALLSSLFVACDRLRRAPRDADGVQGVVTHARRIASVRTPFGFSTPDWRSLRSAAGELLALVESEHADNDDLRELAHQMSDTLRMLI